MICGTAEARGLETSETGRTCHLPHRLVSLQSSRALFLELKSAGKAMRAHSTSCEKEGGVSFAVSSFADEKRTWLNFFGFVAFSSLSAKVLQSPTESVGGKRRTYRGR